VPPALVDTNVLIYLYDQNDRLRQARAEQVLDRLNQSGLGRLSVQSLAEFFSVSTRKLDPPLTPEQALRAIGLFARMWPVFDLTAMIALEAGRGVRDYHVSYYDAQIWATARLNQVSTVFSEDIQAGGVLEGVRFVNPFAAGFLLDSWL
jgi:predicted nucleic acid-binding protein